VWRREGLGGERDGKGREGKGEAVQRGLGAAGEVARGKVGVLGAGFFPVGGHMYDGLVLLDTGCGGRERGVGGVCVCVCLARGLLTVGVLCWW
jgi:hypothetical protein